jgi:hypothetical protein
MKSKFINIITLILISHLSLTAQDLTDDFFRSTGKINTVLAVVLILFFVLIAFLLSLDSRLRKIEKEKKDG